MLGLSKTERALRAIANGEPFTIEYSTYRLFRKNDVIRPEYGYDSPQIAPRTEMRRLESCRRPVANSATFSWTDYRWERCDLDMGKIVEAIDSGTFRLGVTDKGQHNHRAWAAYSGKPPTLG